MTATAAKPEPRTAEPPPAVKKPEHKISELTTGELRDYRHDLEEAIALLGRQHPIPSARAEMQAQLDAVLAEQDDRVRIARA
jgi:hypothetical protein